MKKIIIAGAITIMALQGFAQTNTPATINLSAEARKMVLPDKAIFDISINTLQKTEDDCVKKLNEVSAEVQKRLKAEGFTDKQIKLTNYSINQEYDYNSNKRNGYRAYQSLQLSFAIDKQRILKVYNSLTTNNIENVSVNYSSACSDTLETRIENELIVAAIKNAKSRAELMAKAAGSNLKSIATIYYKFSPTDYAPAVRYEKAMMLSAAADGNAGQQSISYFSLNEIEFVEEVKVSYYIGQ